MNIITLYNNCYVIITAYMLDSDLEPSYNLTTNLLILPWILKLIVDMVNDSTPLMNNLVIRMLMALHKFHFTKEYITEQFVVVMLVWVIKQISWKWIVYFSSLNELSINWKLIYTFSNR